MPGIPNLSLVEGAFEELANELAVYLDTLKGDDSKIAEDIAPLLADAEKSDKPQQTDREAVLKKVVGAASILNSAPERELQAAYNLLIHLIQQADLENPDMFLQRICQYLTQPITSSVHNSTGIALGILGTLFNTVDPDDEVRYHILLAVVEVIKKSGNYATLQPQLKTLESWIAEWELEPEESRKLYEAISTAAASANEPEDSYLYLMKALRTLQSTPASPEARELSIKALKAALQNEKHFDFQDLTSLDSVQALRKSDETLWELLEAFSDQLYEDLQDFKEGNGSFLSDNGLDEDILDRKMRLLTLASLAAQSADTRTLPYARIAKSLAVPPEDVEMWVIDCIRSGLVEGKLSQQKQEFLIHRCTHRTFGEKQWREVASRLETWKSSLRGVLQVIRQQKEEFIREKEAELAAPDVRVGQGYRGRGQRNERQAPPQAVEVE
ncbi:Eukaryotic translation initiation factor 3 subunit M [Teratosphaeria destructans]|uniref:Eukaryotic translation initiation factor 3 subunit M n=1 Tax=Teratosphaeria destructans TaxID=418781 RepID=A0A9W7SVR1_9PEZI|nr:Eukaryotic translation initiation factor 3 subunit M [Teratosphaeria destructans]